MPANKNKKPSSATRTEFLVPAVPAPLHAPFLSSVSHSREDQVLQEASGELRGSVHPPRTPQSFASLVDHSQLSPFLPLTLPPQGLPQAWSWLCTLEVPSPGDTPKPDPSFLVAFYSQRGGPLPLVLSRAVLPGLSWSCPLPGCPRSESGAWGRVQLISCLCSFSPCSPPALYVCFML